VDFSNIRAEKLDRIYKNNKHIFFLIISIKDDEE